MLFLDHVNDLLCTPRPSPPLPPTTPPLNYISKSSPNGHRRCEVVHFSIVQDCWSSKVKRIS